MASQTQGIQQLLQAEKRAAEKVAEARKRKARRLKQAKEEAQAEIEQYRLEREREFQQKQQAALGSQGNLSAEVEAQTRKKLQAMHGGQARGKDQVLRHLLITVWNVQPQIHPNFRLAV
ncbi:V-type proton ATPase subunit G 2 isoform X1 [Protobothrops mucrosquamatus]|uniref:V-type proton ATPase subunit G 2 isoform X1 n=1 Tax=Protobothrops mucrosquamatus TaxID=103944 RepID=UPI000775A190|nr:V-type proton ATPase subunit G 2 isoform X1 [Protobothrops mucrosquamatus]